MSSVGDAQLSPSFGAEATRWMHPSFGVRARYDLAFHDEGLADASLLRVFQAASAFAVGRLALHDLVALDLGLGAGAHAALFQQSAPAGARGFWEFRPHGAAMASLRVALPSSPLVFSLQMVGLVGAAGIERNHVAGVGARF